VKICVISTTVMVHPPMGYSGLEMLAFQQAEGLAKKGHEVVLVAPKGSQASGFELHGTTLMEPEEQAFAGYKDRLLKFDVIVDNSWQKWSYLQKMHGKMKTPVLGVLHAPCNTMYVKPPPVPFPCLVAISKDQAAHAGEIWGVNARVAYNGVDLNFYQNTDKFPRNSRYLFLARFSTIKGPHIAVDVARRTGIELDLVGDDTLTAEPEYLKRIKEQVKETGGRIVFVGPASRQKCVDYFSTRKVLLHMNQSYREPFGLAPVEAQACGMPVIAFDNGAMRETVKPGETGFLVKSPEEVEKLIREDAVSKISHQACREWVRQFSVEAMIDRYEQLVKEAVEGGGW